jgi:hypothetical protein
MNAGICCIHRLRPPAKTGESLTDPNELLARGKPRVFAVDNKNIVLAGRAPPMRLRERFACFRRIRSKSFVPPTRH